MGYYDPRTRQWYREGISGSPVYGAAGVKPFPGDWDGDGDDEPGYFNPANGRWYLYGWASGIGPYNVASPVPSVGDVNRDGRDYIGLFNKTEGRFYYPENPPGVFYYRSPGDDAVIGEWNHHLLDTIGVVRNGNWLLRNSNT